MNNPESALANAAPPRWFYVISALGLVWNLLGLVAFFFQMTMDLSQLADAERAFYETMPLWAKIGFGTAVISGTVGCLALLLRKSWALPMLLLCLAGIVVQIFHSMVVANGLDIFGPEGLAMPISVFVIALLLTWFSHHAEKKGWMS